MRHLDGDQTLERRKGRTLSVSDPFVSRVLAGITIEGFDIALTERWGKSLNAEVRRWSAGRGAGLFSARMLTKADAHRALKHELAKLEEDAE